MDSQRITTNAMQQHEEPIRPGTHTTDDSTSEKTYAPHQQHATHPSQDDAITPEEEQPNTEKKAAATSKDLSDGSSTEQAYKMQGLKSKRGELGEEAYVSDEAYELASKGQEKRNKLGWIKMSVLLCVEAIALGALSLPGAFASVGMAGGVILCVGIGLIAIYAGLICAQVGVKYQGQVDDYASVGRVLFAPLGPKWAKFGYEFLGSWLVLLLVFNYASHTLTGALAWQSITGAGDSVCSIVWVILSAIILSVLALPPTFSEFAWLGYIDFVSICAAILIVMISTGVAASNTAGGISAIEWT